MHYIINKDSIPDAMFPPRRMEIEADHYIDAATGERIFVDSMSGEVTKVPISEIFTMDQRP